MTKRRFLFVVLICIATAITWSVLSAQRGKVVPASPATGLDTGYLTPPDVAARVLEAAPTPMTIVSPDRQVVAIIEQKSMAPIAKLARPILKLAGFRINPKNNTPQMTPDITGLTFKSLPSGTEKRVKLPSSGEATAVRFTPDGKAFAFALATADGLELWVADPASATSRQLSPSVLNGTWGDPCDWTSDGSAALCKTVISSRGDPPHAMEVPSGPNVQQTSGQPGPVRTNQNMLTSAHDEALFDYYFSSQLALIEVKTGHQKLVGKPGVYEQISISPNGEYILVVRLKRPYSRLVGATDFPADVEVWNTRGDLIKIIGELPLGDTVPINGVRVGPRAVRWHTAKPATAVWVEALDGGDPRKDVPKRDRVLALEAPFTAAAAAIAETEFRFQSIAWTDTGIGLLAETDRTRRWSRTWLLTASASPRLLWDRSAEDRYGDPGAPVMRPFGLPTAEFRPSQDRVILQHGNFVYLSGAGASPEGDRPFLDRLDLKTLKTERLFRCDATSYESVVTLLSDDGQSILTRRETAEQPPNLFVIGPSAAGRRAFTDFANPIPDFMGFEKQLLTYERNDGITLSATLYLPKGYQKGQRLPVMLWAYPREFTDPSAASQVVGSPHRFPVVNFGSMYLLFLTQGYAVLDGPTIPIIGSGETANDRYIEQLVASAEAAVKKVVAMGVADPDRIGVGGHSYGAFMTANLLTHSNLFRAGVALSGAYNRTLTPFTFQNERRTFWEAPDVYARMSPFWYANIMTKPLLLVHGEADNNQGTFPIQTERYYMALKGHGATVRYVTLPHESHRYAASETIEHVVAEMFRWFDAYVKNAQPRTSKTEETNR